MKIVVTDIYSDDVNDECKFLRYRLDISSHHDADCRLHATHKPL